MGNENAIIFVGEKKFSIRFCIPTYQLEASDKEVHGAATCSVPTLGI